MLNCVPTEYFTLGSMIVECVIRAKEGVLFYMSHVVPIVTHCEVEA